MPVVAKLQMGAALPAAMWRLVECEGWCGLLKSAGVLCRIGRQLVMGGGTVECDYGLPRGKWRDEGLRWRFLSSDLGGGFGCWGVGKRLVLGVGMSLHERTGGHEVGNVLVSTLQPFLDVDLLERSAIASSDRN